MTTYDIHIIEDGNAESATFLMEENENLYDVVLEVMKGLGFKPHNAVNQKVLFQYNEHTFWEDTLNSSIGLWTLTRNFSTNAFELYTIGTK